MTRKKQTGKRLPLVPVLLCAGVAAGALLLALGGGDDVSDVTAPGVAYLESLEQKDPYAVDQILRQRRLQELETQRVEMLRQVKAGERDPFTLFQDAVILGDSRAVGFFYYGYVDESRDLTGSGDTIFNIRDHLDTLALMNPRYIYLTYGLNDIKIGYWATLEGHISDYLDLIDRIRERVPDSVIVVSSVLPYVDPAKLAEMGISTSPSSSELTEADIKRLEQIPQWNELMKAACAEHGVIFVDNSEICTGNENLWEPDGIHVKKPFYPDWGKNLVIAALEEGGVHLENDPA